MSLYSATLNGCNIIHDCGYMEFGSTSSFESILFADEIIGIIKYMLKPLDFNDEMIPLRIMDRVGPAGNFLTEEHTAKHFKNTFYFPRFLDRNNFETWKQKGRKDLRATLNEQAKNIFNKHEPEKLSGSIEAAIGAIVANHQPDIR